MIAESIYIKDQDIVFLPWLVNSPYNPQTTTPERYEIML